jgi:serine/threonine protein kinase
LIGQLVGNYRITELLGEGGMGAVYLAEHPGIGRKAAVKVLHPDLTRHDEIATRFFNEARAANAIRHPGIVEVYDFGTLPSGVSYIVMEFLRGESLAKRLRAGAMQTDAAVRIASQAADALGAAHAVGIVHRDLKPDNLYVCPDPRNPGGEMVKVLDFGIAKLAGGPTDPGSVKTRTGVVMGTPIYMSPEQCRGTRTVDHRSDIYSLGVIFYEMLVGQPPFVSEGFGDLVNMHLNVPPASARSKRAEIPLALDALVMKMLAKNPEDRYAEMGEVQAALKSSGSHTIVSSPDLVKTHAKGRPPVTQTSPMGDTTFSAGVGERVDGIPGAGRGKKVALGVIAAAAIVGGFFWWQQSGDSTNKAVAVTTPPKPVTPPPTTPVTPPKPGAGDSGGRGVFVQTVVPKKIELRLASVPAGAKVVDNVDGELLGLTPLVLTRPRGGTLTLRFEKDGYNASTRTMPLDGDRAFELTLEQKPKKKERKTPREPSSAEPAKL